MTLTHYWASLGLSFLIYKTGRQSRSSCSHLSEIENVAFCGSGLFPGSFLKAAGEELLGRAAPSVCGDVDLNKKRQEENQHHGKGILLVLIHGPFPFLCVLSLMWQLKESTVLNSCHWLFSGPSGSRGFWKSRVLLKVTTAEWQSCLHTADLWEDFWGRSPELSLILSNKQTLHLLTKCLVLIKLVHHYVDRVYSSPIHTHPLNLGSLFLDFLFMASGTKKGSGERKCPVLLACFKGQGATMPSNSYTHPRGRQGCWVTFWVL